MELPGRSGGPCKNFLMQGFGSCREVGFSIENGTPSPILHLTFIQKWFLQVSFLVWGFVGR